MLPQYTLTNGSFESHFDTLGNGYLTSRGCFLTSHRPSADDGIFFFIRDTESGAYWSATPAPTFVRPDTFRMSVGKRSAHVVRTDASFETALDILIPLSGDFEIRRLTITNHGKTPRRLEVTSSLDIILLFDRLRDSHHQTFSNMFIGAEFSESSHSLLYHRRFFDNPEQFPIFRHRILTEHPAEFLGFETDREAFVGRGRPFGRPLALDRPLKNTSGYILDPLANLRVAVTIAPGESAEIFTVNSAHFSPESPDDIVTKFPGISSIRSFFETEYGEDHSTRRAVDIHPEDIPSIPPRSELPKQPVTPEKERVSDTKKASLLYWNGFGGFDPETHDYHMRICPDDLPPQPWTNILANPHFGTMTTENALGTTWFKNSKHGRLSPWSNNAVTDPPSEAVFLRCAQTGICESLTPSPLPASSEYRVIHGKGYTSYEGASRSIRHRLTLSVHPEHPVKYYAVELTNEGTSGIEDMEVLLFIDAPQQDTDHPLSKTPIARWNDGDTELILNPSFFTPSSEEETVSFHAALVADTPIHAISLSKRALFGSTGIFFPFEESARETDVSLLPDSPTDACAILRIRLTLPPRETTRLTFALVAGDTQEDVEQTLPHVRSDMAKGEPFSLERVRSFWSRDIDAPSIDTPDRSLDILFNTWLPYQTLASRMWAKMGFYQPGGAYGFRDQLQDAVALCYRDPKTTRAHILTAAREQYENGNVRAWWSPDSDFGMRSAASDHPLWLAWATMEYLRLTGDESLLDEAVPYLKTPNDDSNARVVTRETPSSKTTPLVEHALRAIDYVSEFGAHGLPLMREGDWNDGMNRVGYEGNGESVWLGFFLFSVLDRYVEILARRGDTERSTLYRARSQTLKKNLNAHGWDGHWFLRAFYDDGTPLGSEKNQECRIDAIAQSWSVLSGAGDPDKSSEAMANLERFLYDPELRILKLLDPPFNDLSKKNPGYIKDYPPGIRENGSQYNHAVFWAMDAFARLGRADMVAELLLATNPVRRSESARKTLLYEVEPYVVAADIYSAEHRGKGGWTWYTASAGLMFRSIIETLFGIRIDGDTVSIHPSLPVEWRGCSLTLPRKSGALSFTFRSVENHTNTISMITLDTVEINTKDFTRPIALPNDGNAHSFEISLI